MGQHDVSQHFDPATIRRFTRQLMNDVRAMEFMLTEGMFESGVHRIGAEQELFLIDHRFHPAPLAEEVLALSDNPRLVNELTRFNLEINLDPHDFKGTCLSDMERDLNEMLAYTRSLTSQLNADIALAGILPTIHAWDLRIENMAPKPRYFALNDTIMALKGGRAQYHIRGTDELFFQHDNIMMEGCNTSFQIHFQVSPEDFAHYYNIAQLITAPVLAAATNSPVLFGKRLWRETRIALFQQAVDTRSSNMYLREMSPRVHFGSEWVNESVLEIFQEDIARFRIIMTSDYEDPFDVLKAGEIPRLQALQLHNGTVYRWNRACYGISNGKPHVRIENRLIPSGPTTVDEVANAAFWLGLIKGIARQHEDIRPLLDFDDAKSNFIAAARQGLASEINWIDGRRWPVVDLIRERLIEVARDGLEHSGIDTADVDKYMGIISERVSARMTGSQWQLLSLSKMKREGSTRAERLDALVAAMVEHQKTGEPGHTWDLADLNRQPMKGIKGTRVEHFMTTDLFTVRQDELIDFVAVLMNWRHIRHVLVEDRQHRLVGLVTNRALLRALAEYKAAGNTDDIPVSEIMVKDPIHVGPEMPTIEAIRLMRENSVGALPVVHNGELVGIITESDFNRLAARFFDEDAAPDVS
jgi:CBS domain-containing protein